MRFSLVLALLLGGAPALAQSPCVIASFETGTDGWVAGENTGTASRVTTMENAPGVPYAGNGMLEWTLANANVRTDAFRLVSRRFDTPLDLTDTPILTLAVNTYGRPDVAERAFEARVRVWTGGVAGCGRVVGSVATVFTEAIAKNAWTPLALDLSETADLSAVRKIEVGVRIPSAGGTGWFGRHQIDAVEARVVETSTEAGPESSGVGLPYPNPTAGPFTIRLGAGVPQQVRVSVVDALGRTVLTAFDGETAGSRDLAIDASRLAPGLYLVHVEGDDVRETRRLLVTR